MQYLGRAKGGTADIETKVGGAGLGLISVLRSVSKLVFNYDPGQSTEVIGLFDMELFAKGKVGVWSVHVFTARGTLEVEAPADDDDTQVSKGARNDNEEEPPSGPAGAAADPRGDPAVGGDRDGDRLRHEAEGEGRRQRCAGRHRPEVSADPAAPGGTTRRRRAAPTVPRRRSGQDK